MDQMLLRTSETKSLSHPSILTATELLIISHIGWLVGWRVSSGDYLFKVLLKYYFSNFCLYLQPHSSSLSCCLGCCCCRLSWKAMLDTILRNTILVLLNLHISVVVFLFFRGDFFWRKRLAVGGIYTLQLPFQLCGPNTTWKIKLLLIIFWNLQPS